ncbi:hypothetical protein AK812_SmicGene13975 [Symbiodinium microadriaticum]|uniref:Uncharacterized protein n=1 Tax=Symbiodinium microadriaticum TaxID=2951 RepID=A0A1Q9E6P0_SYMMI|nr:hypothetical protein AK812_SmicGene13975 [Symbiodinium microadriaticum]
MPGLCRVYTLNASHAKVEILNKCTGGVPWRAQSVLPIVSIVETEKERVFTEDKVMGQGVIYDVDPDKEYWIHCYGGAADPTYPDVANQMVKGLHDPE